jgi:hypothetical protein
MATQLHGSTTNGGVRAWGTTSPGISFHDQSTNDNHTYVGGSDRGGGGTGDNSLIFGASANLASFTGDENTWSEQYEMAVMGQYGDWGFGVEQPTAKVDINGDQRVRSSARFDGEIQGYSDIQLVNDNTFIYSNLSGSTSSRYGIGFGISDGTTRYPTSTNGISGIGSGMSLECDGSMAFVESDQNNVVGVMDFNEANFRWGGKIQIGGINSSDYDLHVAGTVYSSGSSLKYKENIEDYQHNSESLKQLRPVTYDYKEEFKAKGKDNLSGKQLGLIAEEVAEVAPQVALTIDGVVDNVDYEKLTVMLLAEVQQLRKEIDELKAGDK